MTFPPHCVTLSPAFHTSASAFHTRHNCSQAYTLLSFHNPTPLSMIIRFVCLGQFFFSVFHRTTGVAAGDSFGDGL